MDSITLFDRRVIKLVITTTAAKIFLKTKNDYQIKLTSPNDANVLKIEIVDPDIAGILEQVKMAMLANPGDAATIIAKSKLESVAEIATANLEAAMSKTFPAPRRITLAEIANAVHEAALKLP
jgi:hypothetical protein